MNRFLFLITISFLFLGGCINSKNGTVKNYNYTNALANETSPYLLQHAHNPVDWYPWNDEALQKSVAEDKLLIISIGYAACHWCHVMEHESFEDTTVARIMNENYVSIKVDREERPDVDDIYMTACQLANQGNCGWPLNVITLPGGKPVWVGTYFPKKDWIKILEYFIKTKNTEEEKLIEYANQLSEGINSASTIGQNTDEIKFSKEFVEAMMDDFSKKADIKKGGIRNAAPKFPMPSVWDLAISHNYLIQNSKLEEVTNIALEKMANGGIFDQLGGGFARYATDDAWHIPHFEKMLYDNGQLVSVYSHAFQKNNNPLYEKVVDETINFVKRELFDNSGGFYSSLDADSEKEEGKFYVWTKNEIDSTLKNASDIDIFSEIFDIKMSGNWEEGKNILIRRKSNEAVAKKLNLDVATIESSLQKSKQLLFEKRSGRIRPGTDDKILASWNGLMLNGLCDAYKTFGKESYRDLAIQNADFLSKNMVRTNGQMFRNFKNGKATINAFLDDYANVTMGFISLYQITFDEKWLFEAEKLTNYVLEHYSDDKSEMFFYTSDLDSKLIARKMELTDNVMPSSNSAMARNLFDLGTYLYRPEWIEKAKNMLHNIKPDIAHQNDVVYYANWLQLWLDFTNPPYEVAIIGDNFENLRKDLSTNFLPHILLLGGKTEGSIPLLKDKLLEGETRIYVCQNKVCKFPVESVEKALTQLK